MKSYNNEDFLSKLNRIISYDKEEKINGIMDFDALEKLYISILRGKFHLKERRTSVVALKREKMISIALDFFKSIDKEFYQKARKVILNVDERTNLEIVNANNENRKNRGHVRTFKGKSEVYVPTQIELSKNIALKDDMCTLEDLYTLVHEIAHLLDLNYKDSIPTEEDILSKKSEKFNYKNSFTRELFAESTAISFETLLMEYLMRETDYPNLLISQSYVRRVNDFYDMTASLYGRLQLIKIQEKKNYIDNNDLVNIAQKYNISSNYLKFILRKIISDSNVSLTYRNRYVFAGAISPTIVKKYHEEGSNGLKDYLEAVREDKEDEALEILGIDMNNDGIKQVLKNVIDQDIHMLKNTDKKEKSVLNSVKEAFVENTTKDEVQRGIGRLSPDASKDIANKNSKDQKC